MARILKAKLHPRPAQRLTEDVLVELAGPLMVVAPTAERRHQAPGLGQAFPFGRGHPSHRRNELGVGRSLLRHRCSEPCADRWRNHVFLLLPRASPGVGTRGRNSRSMNSAAWRSWACWKWA